MSAERKWMPADGLADALRDHTQAWHRQAERSGIIRALLRGQASRQAYALLLRNLLPAYQQLEMALDEHRQALGLRQIARAEVYRTPAIVADLNALCGYDWRQTVPVLTAGRVYAARIDSLAGKEALIGHAYVRYLGDLNGGQIIRQRLVHSPGLEPEALGFYVFPAIADVRAFTAEYRASFDQAGVEIAQPQTVLAEAGLAFELNIALSEAVAAASGIR